MSWVGSVPAVGQGGRVGDALPRRERVFGGAGAQRRRAHVGERHPATRDGDGDDGPVVGPPGELLVRPPRPSGLVGDPHLDQDLVGPDGRLEEAGEEVVDRDLARAGRAGDHERHAQREHGRRQVGRRVGVHERAADRAAVADLPVADETRHVRQQRHPLGQQRGVHDVGMTGGRADRDVAVVLADVGQLRDAGDVDEDGRGGEPQLHHRQQRMAAGDELGVVAVLGQRRERRLDRRRAARTRTRRGSCRRSRAPRASTARTMLW